MDRSQPFQPAPRPPSLTIDDAALRLGVSRRTIYNYVRDGRLSTIRVGPSQRVLIESIEMLMRMLSRPKPSQREKGQREKGQP